MDTLRRTARDQQIFTCRSTHEELEATNEDLRDVWPTLQLASQVEAVLARRRLLQSKVSQVSRPQASWNWGVQ